MKKVSSFLFALLFLVGCATTTEPPVVAKTEQLLEVQLPRPAPQQHREVVWHVLSDQEKAEALRRLLAERAFMCLTPKGYENLTHNMSEIRRWSRQMIELVHQYEQRTQATDEVSPE